MEELIKTVGVLVIKGDKILMVKHGDGAGHITGTYGLVAGRLEPGETEVQAAVRELMEESGLEARENDIVEIPEKVYEASIERKGGLIKNFSLKLFVCLAYKGELRNGNNEDTPEWVEETDISKLKLLPNVEKMIEDGKFFKQNLILELKNKLR